MPADLSLPPGTTAEAAIEAAIALYQGYQWRMSRPTNGCRVLIPPAPEAHEATGLNTNLLLDEYMPLATEEAVICGDWNRYVPRPLSNDKDAFTLLLKTCQECDLYVSFLGRHSNNGWTCVLTRSFCSNPPIFEGRCRESREAISIACLHAWKASQPQ